MSTNKTRLFLSHASEDKQDVVIPLHARLTQEGFSVWFDQVELTMGDSLLDKISSALAETDYGVVIFSNAFFAKRWTQLELDGLFQLETKTRKVILPIWHGVDHDLVAQYAPMFAGRLAAIWQNGIESVVLEIKKAVGWTSRQREIDSQSSQLLSDVNNRSEMVHRMRVLGSIQTGVDILQQSVFEVFEGLKSRIETIKDLNAINSDGLGTQHALFEAQAFRFLFLRAGLRNHFPVNAELHVQVFHTGADPLGGPKELEAMHVHDTYKPVFLSEREIGWQLESETLSSHAVAERSAVSFLECLQSVQRGEIELPNTW